MEAMPQAMEILFNEAMLIERSQHLGAGLKQESPDKQVLESLCVVMEDSSICGLGQAAPNPIRSLQQQKVVECHHKSHQQKMPLTDDLPAYHHNIC
jgi:NADH:ubiquinone oxidoreductase subunit F (NADH-binding)